ncbi:MAG: YqaJ viral recombinase family protein [Eubacteriales bacterium]|nr:YqaJ viral recombinase family protein [Eubacteriales bacterium]
MRKLAITTGLPHEEWLRLRRQGIGGSDAAAICDLHPYRSAFQVYMDKTTEVAESLDSESMRHISLGNTPTVGDSGTIKIFRHSART